MKILVQKYRINGELYDEAYSHIQDLEPGSVVETVLVVEDEPEEIEESEEEDIEED